MGVISPHLQLVLGPTLVVNHRSGLESLFESVEPAGSTTASENDTDVQLDDVQASDVGCRWGVSHSMGLAYASLHLPSLKLTFSPLKK